MKYFSFWGHFCKSHYDELCCSQYVALCLILVMVLLLSQMPSNLSSDVITILVEVQLGFFYWLILNCFRNIATPPWLFKTSKLSPLGSVGVKILRSVAFELTYNIEQLEELQLLSSKVFLSNVLYPSAKLDIWWEILDTVSSGKWSNLARVMKKVPIFVRKKYYICSKNSLYFAQKTIFFKWKNFLYLSEKNLFLQKENFSYFLRKTNYSSQRFSSYLFDRDFEYTTSRSWFVWLDSEYTPVNKNLLLQRVC